MSQTLAEGLYSFLSSSAGVTALTGTQGLFPAEGQQGTPAPRVVYDREDEGDDDTIERGHTKSPTARIVLRCYGGKWGGGYASARQLADVVLAADGGLGGLTLKSYRGLWGTVVVQSCRNENDVDHDEPARDGSGRNEQWVELTFSVAYIEQ